jgi:hypothetical protein
VTADPQATGAEPRHGHRGRPRGRGLAALAALILGFVGLAVSVAGLTVQVLPRHFTAAQQNQIVSWQVNSRWRTLQAGQIFPSSIGYQLSGQTLEDATSLSVQAIRVGIAPQSGCARSVTTATAAAVLGRDGCEAVLRATYVDETRSYVMTVGVAVLPSAAAATAADAGLSAPRVTAAHDVGAGRLSAGVLVVRYHGAAAELYDYSRQISASFTAGPYVVMYAAGYADGRPTVAVADDLYSYDEMRSLALGVAQTVAARLGSSPPRPHCPGSPGC